MQTISQFNETAQYVQIVKDIVFKVIGMDGVEYGRSPFRSAALDIARAAENHYAQERALT